MTRLNIHASCVVCGGAGRAFDVAHDAGVLLLGQSGSGKSDLALRLIAMGARLVADDRCEIFFDGAALRARAPHGIAGIMEIRGLGIVAVPNAPEARIALVVRVGEMMMARMPEPRSYDSPPALGVPEHFWLPEIGVDAFAASTPAKILAAVAAFERQLFREHIPV